MPVSVSSQQSFPVGAIPRGACGLIGWMDDYMTCSDVCVMHLDTEQYTFTCLIMSYVLRHRATRKEENKNKYITLHYITVYAHETLEHIVFPCFAMYEYSKRYVPSSTTIHNHPQPLHSGRRPPKSRADTELWPMKILMTCHLPTRTTIQIDIYIYIQYI